MAYGKNINIKHDATQFGIFVLLYMLAKFSENVFQIDHCFLFQLDLENYDTTPSNQNVKGKIVLAKFV